MHVKYFFTTLCAFLLNSTLHSQTYVTTDTSLQTQVNAAAPGTTFIIPDGTYADFYCSFTKIATAENPITIKAATVGGVTFTGDSHFVFKKSAHIILEGFVFNCQSNNTLVKLEASNNIRITRNVFELTTTNSIKWLVVAGYYNDYTFQFLSHHNRIDHNVFKNKTTAGNYITIDGTYNQDQTVNQQSQYDRIDHNYFYNNGPRLENEKEAIRIGNSQLCNSSGFTTVEFNLFEECDGDPEIVSVKSCDNMVRHNTFNRNYGSLTLRQGNRNIAEGNYFFGGGKPNGMFGTTPIYTGGIRAYGADHVIKNNYLEGLQGTLFDAPIALTQGDARTGIDTDFSLHFRGERITVAYNTLVNNAYGIQIGYAKSNGSYNIKLEDITIANNLVTGSQNSLVKIFNDQLGEVTWHNNILYPIGSAQLIEGGPAFTTSQAVVQNPNLAINGGIWKSTSSSPTIGNAVPALNINEDIDGQTRPSTSNAGADHYSTAAVAYLPVTINDVGPNAYEEALSVDKQEILKAIIYPNPTKRNFEISLESQEETTVAIYDVHSRLISEETYIPISGTIKISLEKQPIGLYFAKIKTGNKSGTYKIMKQ
ncbi:Chondroitinase-B precursor [compost metagenome]